MTGWLNKVVLLAQEIWAADKSLPKPGQNSRFFSRRWRHFQLLSRSENLSEDFYTSTRFQPCRFSVCHARVVHEASVTAFEKAKDRREDETTRVW